MTRLDEIRDRINGIGTMQLGNKTLREHAYDDIVWLLAEIERLQSIIDSARVCETCKGHGEVSKTPLEYPGLCPDCHGREALAKEDDAATKLSAIIGCAPDMPIIEDDTEQANLAIALADAWYERVKALGPSDRRATLNVTSDITMLEYYEWKEAHKEAP